MNYSFWEKHFLEQAADVTILGSGIVGLSTAVSIRQRAPECTVRILERAAHPNGASTKNAGFSCFGSVSELLDDISQMGEDACMEVVTMRWKGLQLLRKRLGDDNLHYKPCGGVEVFRNSDGAMIDQCMDSVTACNQRMKQALGLDNCYSIVANDHLPSFESRQIFNRHEGTLDPLRMMHGLYKLAISLGVRVEYGIEVTDIDRERQILTSDQSVQIPYKKLIVCTNGFTHRLFPKLEVVPARNQVLITQPLTDNRLVAGYHLDKGYVYFREIGGRILLGGGRNLDIDGETTDQFGETPHIQGYLRQILEEIYPGASAQIAWTWSGILGVGPSKYPIVRWVDNHVLAGVRMGGMGIAIGSFLGEQLAAEVLS